MTSIHFAHRKEEIALQYPYGSYYPWPAPYPYYPVSTYVQPAYLTQHMYYPHTRVPYHLQPTMQPNREQIFHIVLFSLKPGISAMDYTVFFQESIRLHQAIPGIDDFKLLCRANQESEYPYAFIVVFKDSNALEAFQVHPLHQKFVHEQWTPNVDRSVINDLKLCV